MDRKGYIHIYRLMSTSISPRTEDTYSLQDFFTKSLHYNFQKPTMYKIHTHNHHNVFIYHCIIIIRSSQSLPLWPFALRLKPITCIRIKKFSIFIEFPKYLVLKRSETRIQIVPSLLGFAQKTQQRTTDQSAYYILFLYRQLIHISLGSFTSKFHSFITYTTAY